MCNQIGSLGFYYCDLYPSMNDSQKKSVNITSVPTTVIVTHVIKELLASTKSPVSFANIQKTTFFKTIILTFLFKTMI